MRSTPEWVGKTDDTPAPPRVRLRVFEKYGGRCHITGRRIMPGDAWDLVHVVALANGGENRESNLAPALRDKHREKTKIDVGLKSKARRKKSKHIGIKKSSGWGFPCGKNSKWKKKLDGSVVRRDA